MHSGMIWPNESWVCVSLIVGVPALHVPREEPPDIVKVSGLIGMQVSPAVKGVHVMMCPSDSEIAKVVTTAGARHDLNSVDFVLERLGIGTRLELQEHDPSGDPLHAS